MDHRHLPAYGLAILAVFLFAQTFLAETTLSNDAITGLPWYDRAIPRQNIPPQQNQLAQVRIRNDVCMCSLWSPLTPR